MSREWLVVGRAARASRHRPLDEVDYRTTLNGTPERLLRDRRSGPNIRSSEPESASQ